MSAVAFSLPLHTVLPDVSAEIGTGTIVRSETGTVTVTYTTCGGGGVMGRLIFRICGLAVAIWGFPFTICCVCVAIG